LHINFDEKMGWAKFGVIFDSYLVSLLEASSLISKNICQVLYLANRAQGIENVSSFVL
jgi:hypothetical protein